MKLYELTMMLRTALDGMFIPKANENDDDEIMTDDGELFNAEELEALDVARDEKIEGIAVFIKELEAEKEEIKKEKLKLGQRQTVLENRIKSLKGYLSSWIQGETFKSAKAAIGWRASDQLIINEGAKIPEEYLKYKEPEPDKAALKKAVKNGATFEGVELLKVNNIQIK